MSPFTRDHFKGTALICEEQVLPLFLVMMSQGRRCWGAATSKSEDIIVKERLSVDTDWCGHSFPSVLPSQTPGFADCSQKGRELSQVSTILGYSEKQSQWGRVLILLLFSSSILHIPHHLKGIQSLERGQPKFPDQQILENFFFWGKLKNVISIDSRVHRKQNLTKWSTELK